jgi:hypothetical protein
MVACPNKDCDWIKDWKEDLKFGFCARGLVILMLNQNNNPECSNYQPKVGNHVS